MKSNQDPQLKKYYSSLQELKILSSTSALLEWDMEAKMPVKNSEFRAQQLSYFHEQSHRLVTSKSFVKLVNELFSQKDKFTQIDKRSIELTKKDMDRSLKIPAKHISESSRIQALSHHAWLKAKTEENFKAFQPLLEKMIDLKRHEADYVDSAKPIYDVLLDEYEEGMTSRQLDQIFPKLKTDLQELLKDIKAYPKGTMPPTLTLPSQRDPAGRGRKVREGGVFKHIKFDKHKVQDLVDELVKVIGFDFEKGATAEVHHPFETTLSPNDIRINMSYYHKNFTKSIMGGIHELGHGLYEQNIDPKFHHTELSTGVSLGIHESQSRLLENMIGRSKPFSKFLYKLILKYFPEIKSFGADDIYNDLNIINPSLIRIEADEVTYNLHIILRYEIEQLLLNKKIKVLELPEVWNAKMKELLGIVPKKLSQGCLQDVHWSMGGFGYFPTYTLGNLNAGMLWESFEKDNPNWKSEIENGNFESYIKWFREKIWQWGSFYKAEEIIMQSTGKSFESESLVKYLKGKYE